MRDAKKGDVPDGLPFKTIEELVNFEFSNDEYYQKVVSIVSFHDLLIFMTS